MVRRPPRRRYRALAPPSAARPSRGAPPARNGSFRLAPETARLVLPVPLMARARRIARLASRPDRRLDPKREIVLEYVTDGPARGWLHTHGLARHGKPELELRKVPAFLRRPAYALLDEVADYLLNRAIAPLLPGQTMLLGRDVILFVESAADDEGGYDSLHYGECVRLCLVDPPPGLCDCDECARDLALRSRARS